MKRRVMTNLKYLKKKMNRVILDFLGEVSHADQIENLDSFVSHHQSSIKDLKKQK